MQEGNLVICDPQRQYARNLLQMFTRYKTAELPMYLFHTLEELSRFAEQKRIQTLLIAGEFSMDQRGKQKAENLFVLVKNAQDPLGKGEIGILRYQSAEGIWKQVQKRKKEAEKKSQKKGNQERRNLEKGSQERRNLEKGNQERRNLEKGNQERKNLEKGNQERRNLEKENQERRNLEKENQERGNLEKENLEKKVPVKERKSRDSVLNENEGELIGVYSPVHRIGKTKFAIQLAKELAEKEPVLYLNLEEYAGTEYYFSECHGKTLADLIYYTRQGKGNPGLQISMMTGQDGELDYILPMPYVQDLQEVSEGEWMKLFRQILEHCIYRKIVLDLGDSIRGLFQILKACHVVYTPYIEEGTAHAKLNRYAENLRKSGMECVLEKTIQKKMILSEERGQIRS